MLDEKTDIGKVFTAICTLFLASCGEDAIIERTIINLMFEDNIFTASFDKTKKLGFMNIMPSATKCPANNTVAPNINTNENTLAIPRTNDIPDDIPIVLIEETIRIKNPNYTTTELFTDMVRYNIGTVGSRNGVVDNLTGKSKSVYNHFFNFSMRHILYKRNTFLKFAKINTF